MYYRFRNGTFVEAETFREAQDKLIAQIEAEEEAEQGWHKCTCLGFSHRINCPEAPKDPF